MKNNRRSIYKQNINRSRIEKKYAAIGMSFFVVLLISIFFFIFREDNDVKRIIFFPDVTFATEIGEKLYSGEERVMPYLESFEENVELYVNEVILGPTRPDHAEIIPKNTKLLTIMLRDSTLYINLSGNSLLDSENTILNAAERINAIGSNIKYNFKNIESIYICINGQIPDLSAYYKDNTYNFSDGKNYNLNNIK